MTVQAAQRVPGIKLHTLETPATETLAGAAKRCHLYVIRRITSTLPARMAGLEYPEPRSADGMRRADLG